MADKKVICRKNQSKGILQIIGKILNPFVFLKQIISLLMSLVFITSCSLEANIYDLTSLSPDIVEISSDKPSVTNDVAHLVIKFTEPQTNLTLDSFQITNGILSNLSGGPLEFQATLQPSAEGVVEIKIPGKKITSQLHVSNGEIYSDSYQLVYDTTPPVINSLQRVDPTTSPFTQFIVQIRASVNEENSYVEFFSNSTCTATVGSATTNSGSATLSTNVFVSGIYRYYVKATDLAGNISTCSLSYASYELDVTPPDLNDLNIVLQIPSSSPGINKRPTIRVSDFDDAHAVYLYTDSACTPTSFYGSSYTSGNPAVDVTSLTDLPDGEYRFYVRLADSLSNNSSCSTSYATYIVDTGAPSLPTSLTLLNPSSSPGNDNTPTIKVAGVESGATVSLYRNSSCTAIGLIGSGVASSTTIDITTSALTDGTHTIYANVVDIVGNGSGCSTASVTYVLDTQGPSVPTLTLFNPVTSLSNDTTPTFRISGIIAGDTAKIYSDNTCNTEVASAVASTTTIDLTISLSADGINNFYARSLDPLGNMSGCSSGVSYELDTVSPTAPTNIALQSPLVSPSNDTTPTIRVNGVVSGDTVRLYKNSTCTPPNLMSTGIASANSIDLTTSVLAEGSFVFYANSTDPAGNTSACSSTSVTYEVDLTAPANPTNLTLVNPTSSPSNIANPTVRVAGVATGYTVKLTHSPDCSFFLASEIASGTSVDILIPANFIDGTYNFYVQVVDSSGNSTACLDGALSYTVDKIAPLAPTSLTLHQPTTSPNNDKTPTIRVGGVTIGDIVSLFTTNNCSGGSEIAVSTASGTNIDLVPSAELSDGSYTFYARSQDPAGNQSSCSSATVSYILDTVAPSNAVTLTLLSPSSSPGNDPTPTIRVNSVSLNDTVKLYTDNTCSTEVASGLSAGANIDLTSTTLAEGNYYFYARIIDSSGNMSSCSTNNVYYSLDLTPSASPNNLTLQSPSTSPRNNTTPTIRVHGVVNGDTVSLFQDSSCSVPNQVSTGVASGTTIDLQSSPLTDGAYNFYARSTDPQGNASACSTATVVYIVDTIAPDTPASFVLKNPTSSPSKIRTPEFTVGGVEIGSRVILYKTAGCTTLTSGFVDATASVMDATSTSLADGIYTFSVLLLDPAGNSSGCFPTGIPYQVDNTAPAAPSSLTLQTPSTSPNNDTTPTIRVSGVTNNDTVYLYTDDVCETEVGSAVSSNTFVDVTTSVLVEGVYEFYATSTDKAGNKSNCSTNKVAYILDTTKPTVNLTSSLPSITMESVAQINVTVSETVTGFSLSDISVTNGTLQNLTGSGSNYSFEVLHSTSGPVSVQIPADVFLDGAGNQNSASSFLNYTFEKGIWSSQAYLKAPNTDVDDALGLSILQDIVGASTLALDGDTLAVGANYESSNQTTITNGLLVGSNNSATSSGAVYIFRRTGTTWQNEAYIKAANAEASDFFGNALDLQGDTLVVGAIREDSNQTTIINGPTVSNNNSTNDAGAVYVYKRTGNAWAQQAYIKAVNNHPSYFGSSLSLDGNTLAVGALAESSEQTTITNGSTANSSLTSIQSGAVYIYYRLGNSWAQQAYIKASNADANDLFGIVSLDGNRLAVSAVKESSNQTTINNSAMASIDNSAPESGAVYVFKRTGTSWAQEAYIKAVNSESGDGFGYSISLFGDTLAIGSITEASIQQTITNGPGADADNSLPYRGAVYIYRHNGTAWAQEAYIKSSNLQSYYFGRSVALGKDLLSVGAAADFYKYYGVMNSNLSNGINLTDDNMAEYGLQMSGAVYVYRRTGNQWTQEAYIKASNADIDDLFGNAVSLDGNSLAVAAPGESSSQITITNGDTASADNSFRNSGAVYVYTRNDAVAGVSSGLPEEISASNSFTMTVGGSNITHYRYKVGPVGSTDCTDPSGYSASTPVGTPLSADLSAHSDGEMVVCIIGQTATGLWQTPANATIKKWTKDSSAPTVPSNILDSATTEWTDNTTTPNITWTASTDLGGSVTYEVSLGTSVGATDLMGWTSTGSSATSWSGSGLSISYDVNVYVNVRAKDLLGNLSASASSDGYLLKLYGWKQQAYLKASNSNAGNLYGIGIGISGDTVVIGAPMEKSHQTTIANGTSSSSDVSGSSVGSAYVYKRTGNTWQQEAYLKAANASDGDLYGYIVAIDGDTIAVSAVLEDSAQTTISNDSTAPTDESLSASGAVYIYKRVGTNWHQEAYIKASNSQEQMQFGSALSLSGNTLVVGAPAEASEYTTITNGPVAPMPVTPISQTGAVYVYKRSGSTWAQEAYIKSVNADLGDQFGHKISLSGDTLAVAAIYEDSTQTTIINGATAPTGDASNTANIGAVYIYKRTGTTWAQEAYIKAINGENNDNFGSIVSLDGDTLAVSSQAEDSSQSFISNSNIASSDNSMNNSGAVYVYKRTGTTWAQEAYVKPSNTNANDLFALVSLSGNKMAVGAPLEDSAQTTITNGSSVSSTDNTLTDSGAVYIFTRTGSTWAQTAYIKAANAGVSDGFANMLQLQGNTLVVGSPSEDSNYQGIMNGTAASSDDSSLSSGAVYIYEFSE